VAASQHGVISRDQLRELGLSDQAIDRRLASGRLIALHRGVALIAGSALTIEACELAAVLACRPAEAFVSHRSAAYRLTLLPYPIHYPLIEVITTARGVTSRRGIHVHRVATFDPAETIVADGLPVTAVKRTLLDLATVTGGRLLERAFAAAQRDHGIRTETMLEYLVLNRGRKGVGRLRRLLLAEHAPAFTRSEAEERLLRLVRGAGLPEPLVNTQVGRYEVDFLWESAKFVVEVDGWRWHGDRAAASRDKRRDAELAAVGYRVVRVTWDRLANEPSAVVAHITRALGVGPS
jgi:very-short-patch-repair endonuclease